MQYYPGDKRPLWFVFSGMGSQWAGMGSTLMKIPVFAAAVRKCHEVLRPKGVDLLRIITDPDPKIFNNILNSFIGIAAVQVSCTRLFVIFKISNDKFNSLTYLSYFSPINHDLCTLLVT